MIFAFNLSMPNYADFYSESRYLITVKGYCAAYSRRYSLDP